VTGRSFVWVVLGLLAAAGCRAQQERRIEPVYDRQTGRLEQLRYDSKGEGVDTWTYMDGARVRRIEIDGNHDGKIDRWEYYGPDQKLERVGFSRADDGKPDAWAYAASDGSISRIEVSTRGDGRINRVEYYEKNRMVRAEDDTDGDGKVDKWETYDEGRLTSVSFDTRRRGSPDRRLIYAADGTARLELDAAGDGHFIAVDGGSVSPRPQKPVRQK
jgi:hypothetical protein